MNQRPESLFEMLLWTGGAFVLGLVVSFAFLPLMGVNALDALSTMFSGIFSETYTMGNILIKTAPLILTGLAFAFTYKANLYNIGAQGQFYVGCLCAVAISLALQASLPGPIVIILAMLGAMGGGAAMGLLIGFLKARFNANEFLTSMMSTYVVLYVMKLLLRTVLQETKHEYVQTDSLSNDVWLPKFLSGTSASIGILIAIAAAVIVWVVLKRTILGFRVRATGMNADAARFGGINPQRETLIAFAISGLLAGLAGFIEVNGMQHMLLDNFDSNVGSYGIGIAIMANANPIGIIFCSFLFGILQVGGTVLSHQTSAPSSIIDLMLGIVMLFVLVSFFFRHRADLRRMLRTSNKGQGTVKGGDKDTAKGVVG